MQQVKLPFDVPASHLGAPDWISTAMFLIQLSANGLRIPHKMALPSMWETWMKFFSLAQP